MNNVLIINTENFEIVIERNLRRAYPITTKEANDAYFANLISIIKDLYELDNNEETFYLKLDGGKSTIFRKSKNTNLAIMIINENKIFKRNDLIEISNIYLEECVRVYLKYGSDINKFKSLKSNAFNFKEMTSQVIEQLSIKFIENLRKNKLYAKFVYFNYNPNVINSMTYKKSKLESTSINFRVEPKDTMLQKSTIREKELNIELDKKANPPSEKKIFIKKFNAVKGDQIRKKNISKYFGQNFFIEKYFLTKNTMIHYLFNNIFLEHLPQSSQDKDNLVFPINSDNDHLLLYLLDIYEKAQSLFSVSKTNTQEFVDVVNYVEINLSKPEIMLLKSKMILVKYRSLFVFINLEIYEDKNIWSSVNTNTNFYKQVEILFAILYGETFQTYIE